MKSVAHQYEDKLLEFAYGELPQHEAEAVDAHVRGCNRCSQSLSEIRGVRAAMARLPMEPAPDAGLESLLAYAEQAAKRNAAEAKPAPSIFKRFLMPLASLAALITVGVVGMRASEEFETSPAAAVADQKVAAVEEATRQKEAKQDAQKALAQTETPPKADPAVAPADPPAPLAAVAPQPANKNLEEDRRKDFAPKEEKLEAKGRGAADDDFDNTLAGKKGGDTQAAEQWGPEPKKVTTKSAPQSNAKRSAPMDEPVGNAEVYRQQNYSDVGARVQKMELQKDASKTPPPPPPAPPTVQEKPTFGLGTSSPGSGAMGGASSGESFNQVPSSVKPSPAPPMKAEPKPDPQIAAREALKRDESEKAALAKEGAERKRAEELRAQDKAAVAQPAPVTAAAPSAPSAAPSSNYSMPSKKSKSGYGIRPQLDSQGSAEGSYEDEALQTTDSLSVNNDAKVAENTRRKSITQSVENARVASSRGDRMTEIRLLAQALESGATGYERVEALKRICDAYNALGEQERADPFCDQLVKEFPNTAAAQSVMADRRKAQRIAPAAPKKPAANSERRYLDDASAPKPAEAAPAQSY